MKKKLYLHIGIGKTGTSSIQTMLAESRPQLRELGYLYPTTGIVENAHHLLSVYLLHTMNKVTNSLYKNLLKEIETEELCNIIISSEQFCYIKARYFEEMKNYWKNFDTTIIFYIRNQLSIIPSSYLQQIKQGKNYFGSIEDYFHNTKLGFEYLMRITPWVDAYGRDAIIIRVYDQPRIREDVCSDFLNAIGLELSYANNRKWQNLSLPPEFVNLVRNFDEITDNQEARRAFVEELMKLSARIDPSPAGSLLNAELRNKITAFYKEKNQIFADQFLSDAQSRHFLLSE